MVLGGLRLVYSSFRISVKEEDVVKHILILCSFYFANVTRSAILRPCAVLSPPPIENNMDPPLILVISGVSPAKDLMSVMWVTLSKTR